MKPSAVRTIIAGIAGGLAMNITMLLTFRLIGFGQTGNGILLNPDIQSEKLIAVWTKIKPLPLVIAAPAPIIAGIVLFGLIHAFVYRWLSITWPPGVLKRAARMAALLFLIGFLFWEFFTPFNLFGEPLPLIGLELIFWALIAAADAFTIAVIMERKGN